ncbi:DCTN6 [Bugula neritina]|uniref:Dynactin subunit 6 n=1 Tax=Bugula neritina TaxID=10212 RepID=A0A7J7J396_BUGNE|nr:DCTN6 [Bugula neritina]
MDKPKPNKLVVGHGAIVEYAKTVLKGEITIGKGTIVHPTVQILAEGGPIHIGCNNLLEEGVIIHNKPSEDGEERTMTIGNNNYFEVRSQSSALTMGDNNVLQVTAKLGSDVRLGNGCVIGVGMCIKNKQLQDVTHLYQRDGMIQQRIGRELPQSQTQQIDYLKNMIPSYHKIHKPTNTD